MYSAVLMLALTAGNDSVDFGRNRGHGCSSSGIACSSGGASACSARHGLFGGHGCSSSSGCSGSGFVGCSSGYGCSSSNGCSSRHGHGGGLFSRLRGGHGCNGGSACNGGGGYGCNGGGYGCTIGGTGCSTGCAGGTVVAPPTKVMPKSEPVPSPKKTSVNAPATIVVSLPADARLIVDGAPTTSTSDRRTLVTPELTFGATYVYTFQAEIVREGRTMNQTQQVSVRGGEISNVRFDFSTQTVASR